MTKTKLCRAKFNGGGEPTPCVRKSGHFGKHLSRASTWVDSSSEDPIPGLRGLYKLEWKKPRGESPTFIKVRKTTRARPTT